MGVNNPLILRVTIASNFPNTGHFAQKTFRTSLLAQVLDRSPKAALDC